VAAVSTKHRSDPVNNSSMRLGLLQNKSPK